VQFWRRSTSNGTQRSRKITLKTSGYLRCRRNRIAFSTATTRLIRRLNIRTRTQSTAPIDGFRKPG